MTISKKHIEELSRRNEASLAGSRDKIQERHEKGQMTARERIACLFDEGTFQESGKFAQHSCHDFGFEKKTLPGDGVVTGTGYIDGRPVAAFSQDFMVGGGALGKIHARKDLRPYGIRAEDRCAADRL